MYSSIKLNKFIISVNLGWPKSERITAQLVVIDIVLQFSSPPLACDTDILTNTHCYHGLTEFLINSLCNKTFRLLEFLTKKIYLLTKEYVGQNVSVKISTTKKPSIKNLTQGVTFNFGDFS